jgi:hypothetical protein
MVNEALSCIQPSLASAWGTYLSRVDRAVPYPGLPPRTHPQ